MERPTAEEFAQAPLFRPYAPGEEHAWTDYTANQVVIDGYEVFRQDGEGGDDPDMTFLLEGVEVLKVVLKEEFGTPVRLGTFFNGKEYRVYGDDRHVAAAEFVGEIGDLVRGRSDALAFHMEANGAEFGRDWVEVREGYNYDDTEEEEEETGIELDRKIERELADLGPYQERLGPPARIVRKGFQAWVEGEESPRPWGTVREEFCRVGEDSAVLCPAAAPILAQVDWINSDAENVARHRADLKSLRQLVGNPENIADLSLRAGVHMFDMIDSDAKDAVVPQSAINDYRRAAFAAANAADVALLTDGTDADEDAAAEAAPAPAEAFLPQIVDPTNPPAPRQAERPLNQIMHEATGFRVGTCQEVRTLPTYMREQIRSIGRELLAPHLGGFPMEKVVVARPDTGDPEAYAAFMCFWQEGELVKEVEPMTHRSMPGYRTSDAAVWRRDGWDAIVFSDFMGTYAYAVPTLALDHDLDRKADQENERNLGM